MLRSLGWVILGLAVGIGLGLFLGWVVWPTEFTDATPQILQEEYKRDYVLMIAAAYEMENDLPLAQQRLAALGEDSRDTLFAFVLDVILRNENEAEIRQLVRLAADLGLYSPVMEPFLEVEGGN